MSELKSYNAAAAEPVPTGSGIDVAVVAAERLKGFGLNEIAEDIEARIRLGEKKYGTRLKAHNGRNPWMDLYQEILDGINYSEQCVIENPNDIEAENLFNILVTIATRVQEKLKATA